jgi:putative membrane protein
MKSLSKHDQLKTKTRLALALCTLLAISAASALADDDKDKSQGGTGSGSKSETGQAGQSSQLNRSDEQFVKQACKSGKMEIHMGKMGVQQAQNSQVKQFAQRLVDDHTKAGEELKQLATRKGVTLPEDRGITGTESDTDSSAAGAPGSDSGKSSDSGKPGIRERLFGKDNDSEAHGEMKKLHGLTGTEFDREYVKQAVKHHQKDVREFEQASKKVQDQELKAWIDKTLPTLREHLQTAQSLQASVGSAGAPGSDSGTSSGNSSSGTSTSSGTPSQSDNSTQDK